MKLLVTGGCGFIGSNFIHYWLKNHPNDHIVNLDALTYAGNLENHKHIDLARYSFVYGDICDPDIVRRAMDDVDMVIHFAAESHVDHSIRNCQKFLITNVMGTFTLLEEVRRRGHQIKRFHHISTDEVFGSLELDEDRKFDELTAYAPKNPYAVSKASSDHLCRAFQHTHHLPITISNCTNNYGPYQFPEKLVPRMILQALNNQPLTIHGDGLQVRDWINVEDHARGLECVLTRGKNGENYCFGGSAERSIVQIAKTVLDILNKPHSLLTYVEDRIGQDRRYAMSTHKAQTELGWRQERTFDEGMRQTVEWYATHEAWWKPLLQKNQTYTPALKTSTIMSAIPSTPLAPAPLQSPTKTVASNMKILIFGNGYIAARMAQTWPEALITDTRVDDKAAVLRALDEHQPTVVVNTAGKAGKPTTDWCETHPAETFRSNTLGAIVLAEACQERGLHLTHLSTGCIFYGPSPDPKGWKEDDFANPESVYGRSKYAADLALAKFPNVAILRLRLPIDHTPHPRNSVDKLAKYAYVPSDVENSVTILDDLVTVARQVIERRANGIFHVVNPGTITHVDLLKSYEQYVDPSHHCEWIKDEELVARGLTKARRSNCIMQSPRLEALGIRLPNIQERMREVVMEYAKKKKEATEATGYRGDSLRTNETNSKIEPASVNKKTVKGIILAAGNRSMLSPQANPTSKHLVPLFDRPVISYALQTMVDAGIKQIMVVTSQEYAGQFIQLLGSGFNRNCQITYRIQDEPRGVAHAMSLAEDFVGQDNCLAMLGDSVFEENFQPHIASFDSGALIFYKQVANAKDYGVVEMDPWGRVLSIEERPNTPRSNLAQVGLYAYDNSVFEVIRNLPPSSRGEIEITDVNNAFLKQNKLTAKPLAGPWWDVGTFHGMASAIQYFSQKAGVN